MAQSLSGKENLLNEPTFFYKTGYFTINGFDKEFGNYKTGFLNMEVDRSFLQYSLPQYVLMA